MRGGGAAGQTVACQIGSTRTSVTQLRVKAPTGATADILQVQNGASANQFSVRSDGKAIAHVGLGVGNSAAAATLGSVTGKVEIFDASGTSLGFVPVYDSIT